MHIHGYSSILDEGLGFNRTCLDGAQGQGIRGLGHDGQTGRGDSDPIHDSGEHPAAINFRHASIPPR
jgi:hypothetical protein